MIGHNHDSSIGDMVTAAIMLQVVANALSVLNCDVLVQDGVPNLACRPMVQLSSITEFFDDGSPFDVSISTEHRAPDCPACKNASAGDDGTNSNARPPPRRR